MCGINGIVGLPAEESSLLISKMNDALHHRGPDGGGSGHISKVTFGHRRLSIIDLSDAGKQPMFSSDGQVMITYNGEVYNFAEIRKELTDYSFISGTDTEVILAAWLKWGIKCLNKFNGMFSLAIYDSKSDELIIARDRLGIKPLYFFLTNNVLVFSSEIRALLKCGLINPKLSIEGLRSYLMYQTVFPPNTILQDVSSLKPGSYLKKKGKEITLHTFWETSPEFRNRSKEHSKNEVNKNIKNLFFEAVKKRTISDVPYGAFLSGGIDSSAIVGAMSQLTEQKVKTFSVVFNEEAFSERPYSQMIAKKYNTEHHEIELKPEDFLDAVPDVLQAMDHPSGDGPNTFVVSRETKKAGITVALSGLGGDEIFAGYPVFMQYWKLQNKAELAAVTLPFRKLTSLVLNPFISDVRKKKMLKVLGASKFDLNGFYPTSRLSFFDNQVKLIQKNISRKSLNPVSEMINSLGLSSWGESHILSQVSIMEMNTYMQNVLLRDTDQMSMASALEVRVPFLDHELVEYVLGVKDEFKIPSSPKKLFTDAIGDLVPEEIINRPKMGFVLPWSEWMKKDLKDFCVGKLMAFGERSYINKSAIEQIWNEFLAGRKSSSWSRIWSLVVLETWLSSNDVS